MTAPEPPLSQSATLVLQAVAQGHAYGFEVMDVTGLPSGTVYPLLRRLEARGLVSSAWEGGEKPIELGRPRRRYYQVTAAGAAVLERSLAHHRARRVLFDALLDGPGRRGGSP